MKPMFLGSSTRRLFGVYHPAARGSQHAVLLCYPGMQELNAAHWAFRRLAAMLARDGHHVLRFDYFGTGDSAGEGNEGALADWVDDIRVAGQEILDQSGARSLSLVGMRLGAALATQACATGLKARRLILWEPIVRGQAYVKELELRDQWWNLALLHADFARGRRDELVGQPFTPRVRSGLETLDLTRGPIPNVEKAAVFVASPQPEHQALQSLLESAGVPTSVKQVSDTEDRGQGETRERAVLSNNVLSEISNELRGLLAT
jgi:alpha-beta hydrolase superfamily lysophospholipase